MSGPESYDPTAHSPDQPLPQSQPSGSGVPPSYPAAHPADRPTAYTAAYPPAQTPSFDTTLSAPVSAQPDSEDTPPASQGAHALPPARRRKAPVVAVVLAVLLVAAVGAGAYLAVLSNQWHERSGEWESESRLLGEKVANLTTDLSGMTAELTLTREQLTTAQTRITELADEKAQVGDDRENQKILASDIQAVAQEALDVSASLGDCISAQNTALGYLTVPDSATPEALQSSIDQANSVCTAAIKDYNSLQQDLAAQ